MGCIGSKEKKSEHQSVSSGTKSPTVEDVGAKSPTVEDVGAKSPTV